MESKDKKTSIYALSIVIRINLLLMIKGKRVNDLAKLRQEVIIGEMINESLEELIWLGMLKVSSDEIFPFELTAKGDAATDISLFKGHGIFLRESEVEKTFNNWLNRIRRKKMAQKQENRWYIYPEDAQTNDAVCDTMRAMGQALKETTIKSPGNLPVIESTPAFIKYLAESTDGRQLKFQIFWEDKLGTVREWKLHQKIVKKKAKAHLRKKYLKTPAQKQRAS